MLEQQEAAPSEDEEETPAPAAEPKKTGDELLKKAVEVLLKGKEAAMDEKSKSAEGLNKPGVVRVETLGPLNIPKK